MDKKNENTGPAAAVNVKLKEIKDSFEKNIKAVDIAYDKAKDLMLRLQVPTGEHEAQNELFIMIKTLKDMATTAMRMHQDHLEQLINLEVSDEN